MTARRQRVARKTHPNALESLQKLSNKYYKYPPLYYVGRQCRQLVSAEILLLDCAVYSLLPSSSGKQFDSFPLINRYIISDNCVTTVISLQPICDRHKAQWWLVHWLHSSVLVNKNMHSPQITLSHALSHTQSCIFHASPTEINQIYATCRTFRE